MHNRTPYQVDPKNKKEEQNLRLQLPAQVYCVDAWWQIQLHRSEGDGAHTLFLHTPTEPPPTKSAATSLDP